MSEFHKIYKSAINRAIKEGVRIGLDEYEDKLTREAKKNGAGEADIEAIRKKTHRIRKSKGISLGDTYRLIAAAYIREDQRRNKR